MPPIVGMVGAGQLARMTAEAASRLNVRLKILAEDDKASAARVWSQVSFGSGRLSDGLALFAERCDVVTFDHELVAVPDLYRLERSGVRFWPSAATVAVAQNKWQQRQRFYRAGLPVPAFAALEDLDDAGAFAGRYGWPVVLKAAAGGYDGRGVWIVESLKQAQMVWKEARCRGVQLFVEQFIPVEREFAVLLARRPQGNVVLYPLIDTVQRDGICQELCVPAGIKPVAAEEAGRIAIRVAEDLEAVGILAVEFFLGREGLWINEIAARPHNSGHFSIEGCVTSQFENHLRAVLDWPLGSPALVAPHVVTVNVIGAEDGGDPQQNLPLALALPDVHVHLYGKEYRAGRKLGHVTVLGKTLDQARRTAWEAANLLTLGHT